MNSTAFERALASACRSPLGPLSLSYRKLNDEAWSIDVVWQGAGGTRITARRHEIDVTLVAPLRSDLTEASVRALPWVAESLPQADGPTQARIWLRGDDLTANVLLAAVASLESLAELTPLPAPDATVAASEPDPSPESAAAPPVEPESGDQTLVVRLAPPLPEPVRSEDELFVPAAAGSAESSVGPEETSPGQTAAASSVEPQPPEPRPATAAVPEEPLPAWQRLDALLAPPAVSEAEPGDDARPEPVHEATEETTRAAEGPTTVAGQAGSCPECGEPHPGHHAFCIHCGARLT